MRRRSLCFFLAWTVELFFGVNAHSAFINYSDPAADTADVSGPDIAQIGSEVSLDKVTFEIVFFNAVSPASALSTNSVVGYLDLDVDQNPLTGAASHQNVFGAGTAALGVEYFVDLFSEQFSPGSAEIVDSSTLQPVSAANVRFGPLRLTIEVPRSALGGDGALNYGIVVGNFSRHSDEARNAGLSPASTVPEPPAIGIALAAYGFVAGRSRARDYAVAIDLSK